MNPILTVSQYVDNIFWFGIPPIIGIGALVGLFLVLSTRPDAFDAADRKSRGTWAAMLGGSAFFLLLSPLGWMLFGIPIIAGAVITGVYWMDVRPQIRGILDNAQGGW